jgi:GNAT superfamily N-acetyltransferase
MIHYKTANISQVISIRNLAISIWNEYYISILSKAQIDYMLELIYSEEALKYQMTKGNQQFILAYKNEKPVGFCAYQINAENNKTKIHKLYVLLEFRKLNIGKYFLEYVFNLATANNQQAIFLNVNKYNNAKYFYEKEGFSMIKEEVIDIGNDYIMDDFVMEKKIYQRS